MRVFKSKAFDRFARKETIPDEDLLDAVNRAERGNIAADLGGGVIKQRIARRGGGKSGGYRTIILFRTKEKAFFVYGFAKAERDNIGMETVKAFRILANKMLGYGDDEISELLKSKQFMELLYHEENP